MQVSSIKNQNISFNGCYEPLRRVTKTRGKANIDKVVYVIDEYIYHPFKSENAKHSRKMMKHFTNGHSFSLWEKDHNHVEGIYYFLSKVVKGSPIDRKDAIDKGFKLKKQFVKRDKDYIYDTFNNTAYGVMDYEKIPKGQVDYYIKKADLTCY